MPKTRYFIPYTYTVSAEIEILADSQEEAVELAGVAAPCPDPASLGRQSFDNNGICGATFSYVEDSFKIDHNSLEKNDVPEKSFTYKLNKETCRYERSYEE